MPEKPQTRPIFERMAPLARAAVFFLDRIAGVALLVVIGPPFWPWFMGEDKAPLDAVAVLVQICILFAAVFYALETRKLRLQDRLRMQRDEIYQNVFKRQYLRSCAPELEILGCEAADNLVVNIRSVKEGLPAYDVCAIASLPGSAWGEMVEDARKTVSSEYELQLHRSGSGASAVAERYGLGRMWDDDRRDAPREEPGRDNETGVVYILYRDRDRNAYYVRFFVKQDSQGWWHKKTGFEEHGMVDEKNALQALT